MRGPIPYLVVPALLAVLVACSSIYRPLRETPARPAEPPSPPPSPAPIAAEEGQAPQEQIPAGIFHRVEAGQTLWRIARAYGVPVETLVSVNGLPDAATVEVGQALFIPGATAPVRIAPYPAPPPALPPRAPAALPPLAPGDATFGWPVAGGQVLSYFGAKRRHHLHSGLDIAGTPGQEIRAARAGVVTLSAATRTGYGKLVVLDHGDGTESLYAHDDALRVRVGETVAKGQIIASVGTTGNATTPHCHFEIRKNKTPVDPLPYFSKLAEARTGSREGDGSR